MTNGYFYKSELPKIFNITQNTMSLQSKALIIETMKDYFAKDFYYSYRMDNYGYMKTPSHKDLPLDAGIQDDLTTRVAIQEAFRHEADFFPALIVRSGGYNSIPISFNRERGSVQWEDLIFQDGYGNIATFKSPKSYIIAGAWEGSITIDVLARDLRARDDLVDLVSMLFVDIAHNELVKEGLIILGISTNGQSEIDDRNNKLFKETISLKIRTEWRREIGIANIIEIINTAIEFGNFDTGVMSPNLNINTEVTLAEVLSNL